MDRNEYNCLNGYCSAKLAVEKISSIKNDKNQFQNIYWEGFDVYNNISKYQGLTKEEFEEKYKEEINKIFKTLFHLYVHEFNSLTIKSNHLYLPNYKEDFEFLDINKLNYGRKSLTYFNSRYSNLYYKYNGNVYQIIKVEFKNLSVLKVLIQKSSGKCREITIDRKEFEEKDFFIKKEEM